MKSSIAPIFVAFAFSALSSAVADPVTLLPTADAYVQSGSSSANVNFGSASVLLVKNASPYRLAYLKFSIPGNIGYLGNATLRIYGNHQSSPYNGMDTVYLVADTSWGENTITWQNKPTLGEALSSTLVQGTARYMEWDVTHRTEMEREAGHTTLTFAVAMDAIPPDNLPDYFNSREASSNPPQLVLTPGTAPVMNINFQPVTSPVSAGFEWDTGEPFFPDVGRGWVRQDSLGGSLVPLDLTPNTRDRKRVGIDPLLNTLIHMQYPPTYPSKTAVKIPGAWEYALPDGIYDATVSVGDEFSTQTDSYDSIHTIHIEGVTAIDAFQSTATEEYRQGTVRVSVNDGLLTVDAIGGFNTKPNYITIRPVSVRTPTRFTGIAWGTAAASPIPRSEAQRGVVNNRLYVFGGYYDSTATPTARSDMYDPVTDTWTQLPDLPEPITHAGTTVVGTNIYLAGGYLGPGGNKYQIFGTTHVWKFDTVTLQWSAMPPLPEERGGGSLVALFGVLHFFGGADLQRLDVSSHWMLPLDGSTQWISAAPLPHPRNHLGGVALNGRIYAVGGETGQDSAEYPQGALECWDPATGAWTALASMPKPRSHIAGATMTMDNRIIVLGGEIAYSTSLADVIAYDAVTNTWESLAPLPAKRHSGVAAALLDRIYYSGKCSCTSGPGLTTTYVGDPQ